MFCPQCRAEYRPGFTRCSDCDLDLVEELSQSTNSNAETMKRVWTGHDQDRCVSICEQLRLEKITFRVVQHSQQFLKGVDQTFKIFVPGDSYDRAKKTANNDRVDFSDEPEDQAIMELQVEGANANEVQHQSGAIRSFAGWNGGDATVEIWSCANCDREWMLVMSLRENVIKCRLETKEDGLHRLFVRPEDESRARQIAREVSEGIPPE
jgi:hypothetical protein